MLPSETELSIYSARDCVIQRRLYEPSIKHLSEINSGLALMGLQSTLGTIAEDMTWRGLRVDMARRKQHQEDLSALLSQAEEDLQKAAFASGRKKELNPRSAPQLRHYFYTHLGAKPPAKSKKTKEASTSVEALSKLLTHPNPHVAISAQVLLRIRKFGKMLSTYIDGVKVVEHKARPDYFTTHPMWQPGGALTGRWVSKRPNMMNLPKESLEPVRNEDGSPVLDAEGIPEMRKVYGSLKDIYISHVDSGYVVECDYAQIEARIIALLAEDEHDLDLYEQGADTHSDLAWDLFHSGKPKPPGINKTHVSKTERQLAKTARYLLMYGGTARKLHTSLKVDFPTIEYSTCAKMHKRYFRVHHKVKKWQEATLAEAASLGRVREPLSGRERIWWGPVNPNEALNFKVQTAAGYIINNAIQDVYKELSWPTEGILLQLHDALYLDGPDPARLAQILVGKMSREINLGNVKATFPVDVSVGRNCAETKEMSMKDISALPTVRIV